ncbi:uncharacterized protein [Parasteatoda tepidariorum]|uniref:uncharacterized protein n=1 Tax=Parasteatoda tepidariorum TaxID=114398 RepID=UPI001C727AD2|nr:uncharacterized protein LOC107441013 [Parasteatoda tepidariorum]
MKRVIIICLLVIVQSLVSCQVQDATESFDPLPTSTHDPYANVLSQLSDAIVDVEDRLYRLTAPKYESENPKMIPNQEKDNRRRNYFDRIRDNYKTLQDQVSQSLSSGGMIKMSDILNLNFHNTGQRSSLDLSLPFLPLNIKVDAKKPPTKKIDKKSDKDGLKPHSPLADVSGNINLGIKGIFDEETSKYPEKNEKRVKPELQKRSSRPIRTAMTSNKKISNKGKISPKVVSESSKRNSEPHQDREDETGIQGRILGDVLFSESTFDKYFRRLLKDHGKWLLDSNISPPKKIIEGIRGITRDQFASGTSSKSASRDEISYNQDKESNLHSHKHSGSWRQDAETKIVLAFTPDGLPLKLKIDPSVNKPLKFLHRILSEGGVSLNIPVSTTNGIHSVGSGVLHLGFEDSGIHSRTPLLDLSDSNQLNYLLRTLRKLKYEHH